MQPLRPSSVRATRALCLVLLLAVAGCGERHTVAEPPNVTLILSTTSLELRQGEHGTIMIGVARSAGFARAVTLTVVGAPQGLSATLEPARLEGDAATSQLTLTASAAVPAGTYTLSVRASGREIVEQSATITVTVRMGPVFGG